MENQSVFISVKDISTNQGIGGVNLRVWVADAEGALKYFDFRTSTSGNVDLTFHVPDEFRQWGIEPGEFSVEATAPNNPEIKPIKPLTKTFQVIEAD